MSKSFRETPWTPSLTLVPIMNKIHHLLSRGHPSLNPRVRQLVRLTEPRHIATIWHLPMLMCAALFFSKGGWTAVAATEVSGMISGGVWTQVGSPYLVVGDLLVAGLDIEPGVEVVFQGRYRVEVIGLLSAIGTETDKIVFRPEAATSWRGIYFNQGQPGSRLVHCSFMSSSDTAVLLKNCAPEISDCYFYANSSATNAGAVAADIALGNLTLRNCSFVNNSSRLKAGAISAILANGEFTLENCAALSNSSISQAAVFGELNRGNMVVRSSRFSANSSQFTSSNDSHGGGLGVNLLGTNTLSITDSVISSNSINRSIKAGAPLGAGIFVSGSAVIDRCTIDQNRSWAKSDPPANQGGYNYGGAMYFDGRGSGSLVIRNSMIQSNSCVTPVDTGEYNLAYGGGLLAVNGRGRLENCVFQGNSVSAPRSFGGGGIALGYDLCCGGSAGGMNMDIVNTTIVGNEPEGVLVPSGSSLRIYNSVLFANGPRTQIDGKATVQYSCVEGGYAGIENIAFNPMFVSPATGDFSLLQGSPCIDRGNPSSSYNDTCLPPAGGGERNDIGAYGGPGACNGIGPAHADSDLDGLLDAWEIEHFGNLTSNNGQDDSDADKLANQGEYDNGTNPLNKDTDGDKYSDYSEVRSKSDPLDPASTPPPSLSIKVSQVELSTTLPSGQNFQIQASADLKNWFPIETVPGLGDLLERTYNVTNGRCYFRLMRDGVAP